MNEEEKKFVELLEHCQNTYIEDTLVTRLQLTTEEAKILLNLIKKLQKEIADLKMQNHIIKDMDLTVRKSKEVFDEIYIRKDKITELIQEITSYAYTSLEEKEKYDYAIYELKRLLGE